MYDTYRCNRNHHHYEFHLLVNGIVKMGHRHEACLRDQENKPDKDKMREIHSNRFIFTELPRDWQKPDLDFEM